MAVDKDCSHGVVTPPRSQLHLNAAVADTARVRAQRDPSRTRDGFTRGDIETSVVLRTFDLGAVDETFRKGSTTMRAQHIDRKDTVVGRAHDRDGIVADVDADDVGTRDVVEFPDNVPLRCGHGNTRASTTDWSSRCLASVGSISRTACQMLRCGVGNWSATAACNFGRAWYGTVGKMWCSRW